MTNYQFNRGIKLIILFFILSFSSLTQAQEYKGFLLQKSKEIHRKFKGLNQTELIGTWANWGDDSRYIFTHLTEFWPHTIIKKSFSATPLPVEIREDIAKFTSSTRFGELPLKDFIHNANVDGVVIVHHGKIVYEEYPRMYSNDKHIYMSISKTFVSTAIAILEDRNLVDSQMPINHYFPKLNGTDWEGIKIIDILDMSSGIDCPFDWDDPDCCFHTSWHAYGWPISEKALEDPIDSFRTLKAKRNAGELFEYADINPLILTLLVENATGQRFSEFMEKNIWQPMGAESDATFLMAAYGRVATPLGVSSTLRDMARYGLLFTPSGHQEENSVISDAYLDKIINKGRPELYQKEGWLDFFGDESISHNTYQWDCVTKDGDFMKTGSGDQTLYISPSRDLVITFFATDPAGHFDENFVNAKVARQLALSGLFDQ
jgi:CubicO group peptidase (beta-lactamase class C family)